MRLDDAGASILLSPIMAVLFLAARGGRFLLQADRCSNQSRRNGGRGFHLRTQLAWPAREHCRHGGFLHCHPGHLEGAVEIGKRDRYRFLMRSDLRRSAPRGRGAAHGAVPRGRVAAGDGIYVTGWTISGLAVLGTVVAGLGFRDLGAPGTTGVGAVRASKPVSVEAAGRPHGAPGAPGLRRLPCLALAQYPGQRARV
jgi:hypothetical protein